MAPLSFFNIFVFDIDAHQIYKVQYLRYQEGPFTYSLEGPGGEGQFFILFLYWGDNLYLIEIRE